MSHQKLKIPKYTDNINNNNNKKRPNMDDIINEQHAEELQKQLMAEQCEHNLDEIPAELLLESYMLSQLEEQKELNNNNNNNNDDSNNNNNNNSNNNDKNNNITQEEHDRLLAMQLEFALDEEHILSNIDNNNDDNTTTTTTISPSNKKLRRGKNNRYGKEAKIRIQPNYYFDDQDNNNNGERAEEEYDDNNDYDDVFDRPKINNNNNSKIRHVSIGSGNKTIVSGTANRHRFEEWSEKHVCRLHEYNANLGEEFEYKNVRLGNKAYNSFRRDLEKKGFKKFDQPTPVDKK